MEDDEDSREALKMYLEMHGCVVVGTSTAAAGLDALRSEDFDLVITDFNLPDRDGLSMLEHAANESMLDCEALIVTGSYRIRPTTIARVLVKPLDPRALLALVRSLTPPLAEDGT